MFKDWLPMLLLSLSAGQLLLVYGLLAGGNSGFNWRKMFPGFLLVGAMLAVGGGLVIFTWPVPGPFSLVWGTFFFSFGMLFLLAGLALALSWDIFSLGIPLLITGAVSIVLGTRIIDLGLTLKPIPVGVAFITTGLSGIMVGLGLLRPGLSCCNRWLKIALVVLLGIATVIWLSLAVWDYWRFFITFSDYTPAP